MQLRLFTTATVVLAVPLGAQNLCRLYLANHTAGNAGFSLSLEAIADSSGKCQLGSVNLRLATGDGTALHHVDATHAWQNGMVYTVQAVISAAGPQQLSIGGQPAGTSQAAFQPAQATLTASLVTDSPNASEAYIATQISLQITNGSNTVSIAPNGTNPIPIPLVLLARGPAPWQTPFTVNPAQTITVTATFRFDAAVADVHRFDPYIDTYGQAIAASWPGKIMADGDLKNALAFEQTWLASNPTLTGFDQYGGSTVTWTDQKTGYYHTAYHGGHWFLISPLGNPLFYLGITAVPSYSTPITGREAMFQLPPDSGAMTAAYSMNINPDPQDTTYFSFSVANQVRKYGSFSTDAKNAILALRLASWGFTGGGKFGTFPTNMPSTPILAHGGAAGVPNAVPGGHPDVFDPAIVNKLKAALAAEIGSNATNPYIIGWSVGNEDTIAGSEVSGILALSASSPAKKALVDHAITVIYSGSVKALAAAWNISATTAADVYASQPSPPPADIETLRRFYEQAYYSANYQTVKAIDPNHLYFGSWTVASNGVDFPIAAANCDVVGFDNFSPGVLTPDLIAQITAANKPVMLGAWGVPSDYAGTRGFGWNQYTQAMTLSDSASGDAYALTLANLAANQYVVGAMLFDYFDEPLTGRGNSAGVGNITSALVVDEDFAFGLVDVTDTPKYDLVTKVRAANIAALQNLGLIGANPLLTVAPANGATYFTGGLVPGSWAQIKGTNLADPLVNRNWLGSDFAGLGNRLPTNLSGVQVLVNESPAAVYYVSPTQVSFQVPAGISGTANVQVIRDGIASNILNAPAVSSAPGIFPIAVNGVNYAAGVFLDGKIVGDPSVSPAFRKAKAGETISLYATGLAVSPAGTTVSLIPISGVSVTMGTITVPADFAGLVAVGEFQINFTVPREFASLAEGNYPVTITVNGVSSPATINSIPVAPVVIPTQH